MTIEENARLEASIADAITVQQQFFHNQFNEASARSEKVCSHLQKYCNFKSIAILNMIT